MSKQASIARTWPIAVVLGTVLSVAVAQEAFAQEKCQRKLDNSGAKSKYTEQHTMDVGDVKGHQIRIYELHRTFASDQPNCEGLKRKEIWSHGYSDYINLNGRAWGYTVIIFDNEDQIFAEFSGASQTVVIDGDKKQSTYAGVTNILVVLGLTGASVASLETRNDLILSPISIYKNKRRSIG